MRYIISFALATLPLPALAAVPQVVADTPAVQSLAAQVMGDLGAPVLLLERGASEHDLQLRPSQRAALEAADLVFWVGPELSPVLADILAAAAPGRDLALLAVPGVTERTYIDFGHGEAAHGDEGDEGHDHSGHDPHAWLDPTNAMAWTRAIAAALSSADPDNAAIYAANATVTLEALSTLDAELEAAFTPVRDQPFLTYHDAYGHLAARYGLAYRGALASGEAATPGAAHLADLQAELSELGRPCLFPEAQHDAGLIAALAEGSNARIGGALDPSGTALHPGPEAYGRMMRDLAATLVTCLSKKG